LLLTSKSNTRPAKLTIWQHRDQEINFYFFAPSRGMMAQERTSSAQETTRCRGGVWDQENTLFGGGGAHTLEGGGRGGRKEMGWPKF
jgi:hypothetical protein